MNERFQRGEGTGRVMKPRLKSSPRPALIVLGLGAMVLLFFGVYELYSFLLTWDDLAISSVEIRCPDPAVKARIEAVLAGTSWGNILVLDAAKVKARVEACPWVAASRVRKIFPSTLRVEAAPRRPAAILEQGAPFLIARDNVVLGPAAPDDALRLPRLVDESRFAADREDKLALALACLAALGPDLRERAEIVDLTDPGDLVLTFRGDPTRLKLGGELFFERAGAWLKNKDRWIESFGAMEYVDLRFSDRTIFKPALPAPAQAPGLAVSPETAPVLGTPRPAEAALPPKEQR